MTNDTIAWLQTVDWRAVLTMTHIAAMILAFSAAIAGHAMGARFLYVRGPRPARGLVGLIHGGVVTGLVLLWLSGGALAVDSIMAAQSLADMTFKLCVAAILSLCVLLVQEVVLPLVYSRRRPLAVNLGWGELAGVAAIVSVSLSCWIMLAASGFVQELQVLSIGKLFGWLVAGACLVFTLCLLTAGMVRMTAGRRRSGGRSRDKQGPQSDEPAFAVQGGEAGRHGGRRLPQRAAVRPSAQDRLAHQFRQTLGNRRSNDNAQQSLPDQIEQARQRTARPRDPAMRTAAVSEPEDDNRRRRKWLRRPRIPDDKPADADNGDASQQVLSLGDVKKACRRATVGAAMISFVSNMLMLTGPLFMLQIYDRVLTSKSLPTLTALFTLTLALFAFMGLLDLIRSRLLVRIGLRIDRLIGPQVFARAIEVGDAGEKAAGGQLLKDVQHIRQFVSGAGITAIFDMPWAPVYFAIVMMFHWALGVVALVGAAVLVVMSLLNEWLSRKPVAAAAKLSADAEQLFDAGRRNSEVLQAMGMQPRLRQRWLEKHSAELLVTTRAADIAGLLSVLTKTARLVLQSAMLAMGAYLVLGAEISPGVMIASSIIMSRALAPIELAISHWRGLISARQGMERLSTAFANAGGTTERLMLPEPQGRIEVNNVFAAPIGSQAPVLKGLNFQLQPGDALGVLGPSGSGKSTLARVLVGVWPTLRGRVSLDGAPLEHWREDQLGRHIGYLPQDATLFDGTVADNISRFTAGADPGVIIAAAESANVHTMILGLEEGYNTQVGEGGTVLSGGQRQRIALARALFGQPAFVVLDEPNANLDSDGESALADAIAAMRRAGRTVVVMAHRRKALEHVNLILVLKEGRQVTFGPKSDVLKAAAKSGNVSSLKRRLHAAE